MKKKSKRSNKATESSERTRFARKPVNETNVCVRGTHLSPEKRA